MKYFGSPEAPNFLCGIRVVFLWILKTGWRYSNVKNNGDEV